MVSQLQVKRKHAHLVVENRFPSPFANAMLNIPLECVTYHRKPSLSAKAAVQAHRGNQPIHPDPKNKFKVAQKL
jgi:hypothetical protein